MLMGLLLREAQDWFGKDFGKTSQVGVELW